MPRSHPALLVVLAGCFPDLHEFDPDTHEPLPDTDTDVVDTDAGDTGHDTDPGGDTALDVVPVDRLITGQLELTEVHLLPADCTAAQGQYVELRNVHSRTVNLRGLRLQLGTATVTVSPSADLLVPTGEYAVGVTSQFDCPWGDDVPVAFTFPAADVLPRGGATVALKTPADVVLDDVSLRTLQLDGSSPTATGHAVQRFHGAWCMADKLLPSATADFGTPGAEATGCFTP